MLVKSPVYCVCGLQIFPVTSIFLGWRVQVSQQFESFPIISKYWDSGWVLFKYIKRVGLLTSTDSVTRQCYEYLPWRNIKEVKDQIAIAVYCTSGGFLRPAVFTSTWSLVVSVYMCSSHWSKPTLLKQLTACGHFTSEYHRQRGSLTWSTVPIEKF